MYGSANENVECTIKNMIVNVGLMDMKPEIWLKCVNGIKAIEMNMIAYNSIVKVWFPCSIDFLEAIK